MNNILVFFIIISAILDIKAVYSGSKKQEYFFKPLTTTLIIILAFTQNTILPDTQFYKNMILSGLFFSLLGDIFIMLPSDKFIQGLISFLIAHIFYIIAFNSNITQPVSYLYILPFIIYGFLMFGYLYSNLDKLKIPVIVYITIIMIMVFESLSSYLLLKNTYSLLAFIGAFLFMISDTVLAIDKFKKKFKLAELIILSTYFSAQVFIALSI